MRLAIAICNSGRRTGQRGFEAGSRSHRQPVHRNFSSTCGCVHQTRFYGHMLGSVRGDGHWYRGNWELRGELFTGAVFSPGSTWGIGLTPHLRYNFATGTRWVPFADIGAGVTATGEHAPDLGGAFEFNLQAAIGTHWFVRDNLAVTMEARYLHVSSAGIYTPNLGLNTVAGLVGLTWFF